MANNKRTAAGDRNKRIQVERRRGSVVEKIEGTASQIARYDNHSNEYKAATKGTTSGTKGTSGSRGTRTASSFKAALRSGVRKLLASGLNLLQGATIVATKIGVDAANKIGGIPIICCFFSCKFEQRRRRRRQRWTKTRQRESQGTRKRHRE
ncbi:uncharacterized protein LOC109949440 isoform X3 [Prunus persica]|uniref:uncharacterized protein LOC109949440 isoform X3 n=1 Tax=Prunus persica TaxID=3760 RepID=UPI0009AB3A0C|nr:uncharacterized protein LOC109949440 isoform X3 [Prunus persica]